MSSTRTAKTGLIVRSSWVFGSALVRATLTFSLLVVFTAGCTTERGDSEQEVVIWHAYEMGGSEHAALNNSIARFALQNPNVQIRTVAIPFEPFTNKVNVSVPRGNGPDILIFAHDPVGDWASKGLIEPLSLWHRADELRGFTPNTISAFVWEKHLYAYPLTAKTLGLYYNPKLVSKAPATTTELVSEVNRLGHRIKIGFAYDLDDLFFHSAWLYGFKGRLLDGDRVVFGQKNFRQSLTRSIELVRQWAEKGVVPTNLSFERQKAMFAEGEIAFVMSGSWFRSGLEEESYRVAPLPRIGSVDGLEARPFMSVEGVFVSAFSRNKPAAVKFSKFLASAEESASRRNLTGQVSARSDLPSEENSGLSAFQIMTTRAVPTPNSKKMKAMWTPINRLLSETIVRKREVGAAIDEAVLLLERGGTAP